MFSISKVRYNFTLCKAVKREDIEAIPESYKRRRLVNGIACQARYWKWKEWKPNVRLWQLATRVSAYKRFRSLPYWPGQLIKLKSDSAESQSAMRVTFSINLA